MAEDLTGIGKYAQPLTMLIEKVSGAIEGTFRPFQVKRVAKAEAEAEVIRGIGQIELSELQQRAMRRVLLEEEKKQFNMENVVNQASALLSDRADPRAVDNDWIAHVFEKCRDVSDEEMQL